MRNRCQCSRPAAVRCSFCGAGLCSLHARRQVRGDSDPGGCPYCGRAFHVPDGFAEALALVAHTAETGAGVIGGDAARRFAAAVVSARELGVSADDLRPFANRGRRIARDRVLERDSEALIRDPEPHDYLSAVM